MSELFESLRSTYRSLDPASALEKPTSILLGISQSAANALSDVGISTVFDLASSALFMNAVDICLLAESRKGRFAITGKVPRDVLQEGHNKPIADLPLQPISILSTYATKTKLEALAATIDITSIRDLAAWPPYHTARKLLDRVYNPLAILDVLDSEAPADLVPANDQYPTERVQYEVLLFNEFVGEQATSSNLRPLGSDGALDVSQLLSKDEGYTSPAIGGILTFTQSWYTKGLALGNLIHSVALGPGESTKIAMIDWARKVRTSATEDIQQNELLHSDLSRSRALNEITSAVARETQRGESAAHSESTSTQRGESTGGAGFRDPSLSPLSILAGVPISLTSPGVTTSGTSFGTSTGTTDATSWSTSSGQRDVAASLSQDIVDRTHQAARSARNRRASIVREVSQQESESISTRTLTNYNHMHALTIEYYEVVQLYRTVVELSKADRCLFVPMKLIDFRNITLIDRYRPVLIAAAISSDIREALQYPAGMTRARCPAVRSTNLFNATEAQSPLDELSEDSWLAKDIREAYLTTAGLVRVLPDARLSIPSDAVLQDIDFVAKDNIIKPVELSINKIDGTGYKLTYGQSGWDLTNKRARIDEILTLTMTASGVTGRNKVGFVSVIFAFKSTSFRIVFPVKLEPNVILQIFTATAVQADIMSHLQDNRLYYSQVVWRSLDPATIGILLSGYTWTIGGQAKALVELVDPTPVAIVANYLVLRLSGDDQAEWNDWLKNKKIIVGNQREDLVPVPSGGVFAEAVLGRFNSAEKLDITRFWNWQDSPIPIQAPDIAAIQAGSRRDPDTTTPGQLGTPVLNIVNPPALPDPQGMGAILAAIQNGNMFRDMSGLAATIGLAQAGLAGAQQGATDAAAQAGQNAAVAAQLGAKVAELAAKLVAAYFTGGASLAAGAGVEGLAGLAGGISGQGAKINQGKDMDQRGIPAQTSGGAGTSTVPSSSSGTGDGSNTGPTGSGASGARTVGNEGAAFNAALGGGSGGILGQLLNTVMGQAPVVSTSKAWPRLDRIAVLTRLNDLKGNANLFNQGSIGLCTAAAFYHHIIQKDPLQFYSFAVGLYGSGIGFLGKLKVAPDDDLRNTDYIGLAKKYSNMPPQADWMLMSALRDSENWFFDFEGAPDETTAMRTSAAEMSDWYEKTGFYSSVTYSSDRSLAEIKKIQKKARNHIALWIDIKLLNDPRDSTHIITLESPMTIDEANNKVKFDYWTWGQPVKTLTTTVDALKSYYLGVIIVSF